MVSQCGHYTGLLVQRRGEKLILQQRIGRWAEGDEVRTDLVTLPEGVGTLYLRMLVKQEKEVSFCYDLEEDGEYPAVGEAVEAQPGRWVGVKAGLTAVCAQGNAGGSVKIDYFVFEAL